MRAKVNRKYSSERGLKQSHPAQLSTFALAKVHAKMNRKYSSERSLKQSHPAQLSTFALAKVVKSACKSEPKVLK